MKPVRIAFVATDLDPGGAERALVRIVKGLDRAKWNPRVWSLKSGGVLAEELRQSGIEVTSLNVRGLRDIGVLFRLAREWKEWKPSIVQGFLFHANILSRLAAWLADVLVVFSGIRVAEKRSCFRLWLDWLTSPLVTRHICVSRGVASFSQNKSWLPARKLVVIPNGVDLDRFASAAPMDLSPWGISPTAPVCLVLGRLDPQKGIETILDCWPKILTQVPEAWLVFVGEGPLRTKIETCGHQKVVLTGWQPLPETFLARAQVLLVASLWEGMPNVVLEAMASGTPVVTSKVEGIEELIQDGETGLLFSQNPPRLGQEFTLAERQELVRQVSAVLTKPVKYQQVANNAQAIVGNRYQWTGVVRSYEELYETLLYGHKSDS